LQLTQGLGRRLGNDLRRQVQNQLAGLAGATAQFNANAGRERFRVEAQVKRQKLIGADQAGTGEQLLRAVLGIDHQQRQFNFGAGRYALQGSAQFAVEGGEGDFKLGWSWGSVKSRAKNWLDEKKINIILQMGLKKADDLPNVPFIMDYAKTSLDKQALELVEELRDLTGRDADAHHVVQGAMTSLRAWISKRYSSRPDSDVELRPFFNLAALMLTNGTASPRRRPAPRARTRPGPPRGLSRCQRRGPRRIWAFHLHLG